MALSKIDENGNIVILPDIIEKKTFEKEVDKEKLKKESHEILSKPDAYSLLAEVRAAYDELLEDAICLYQHYPNNFRKTADEYFKKEIEIQKKLSDHFS